MLCMVDCAPFNKPIFDKKCLQCWPINFPLLRFSGWLRKLVVGDISNEVPDEVHAVDGVLNVVGENLLVVQEVTVCSRPLCSLSERGVRWSDVAFDANLCTHRKNKEE